MSVAGRPSVRLDSQLRVRECTVAAAALLGVASTDDLVGVSLDEHFDADGRAWLRRSLAAGGRALVERPVRTRSGRILRLAALHDGLVEISDDSGRAAVAAAREHERCAEAQVDLAAAVARELNDPMAIVQGRLELLEELTGQGAGSRGRHLQVALDHARRVGATLHLLRLVGRPAPIGLEPASVPEVLQRALALVDGLELEVEFEQNELSIAAEPELLEQVLVLLLVRLHDAASRGFRARIIGWERGGMVELNLLTTRESLPTPPLTSALPAPNDPRLDIGVASLVIRRIGGSLEGFRLGAGVLYRLRGPAPSPPRARARPHDRDVFLVGLHQTELARVLDREGFSVRLVTDGEEGLEMLETGPRDAIVAGLNLPGMSGLAFAQEALRRWPELAGAITLVTQVPLPALPEGIAVCKPPVDRVTLLTGLRRRARRRRRS